MRRAFAPGRVNLIGEHTDYTGGLALPMAVQLGTTVQVELGGDLVVLTSADEAGTVRISIERPDATLVAAERPGEAIVHRSSDRSGAVTDPVVRSVSSGEQPSWGRLVAGVVAELRPGVGATGTVRTTLPIGAGLSSSAALELAVALALGFEGSALELALLGQRAEHRALGVPCGLMDQLTSASGVAGHALLLDCRTNAVSPVRLPDGLEVVAVHSGERRTLAGSAYAERAAACVAAEAVVGPLRDATLAHLGAITDAVVHKRARHVVTENARVLAFVDALTAGDLAAAGRLMAESHASLRDDFEVSTPALDALVERLAATPGVHGARLTGAGFGGCAVAITEPGALREGWRLEPVDGARPLTP